LTDNSQELVRKYFNREAQRFDAIYETRKPWLHRAVDHMFRQVVVERFKLICALAPTPGPWTVLDVGCGSGRYALALADAGATRVLGVDGSDAMIELARQQAQANGVASVCEFAVSTFLDFQATETFDVVVATGYFDYLEDPAAHLRRMLERCRGRIFASVPKRWEWRVPTRKLRFAFEHGFVRFYSRAEFEAVARVAGVRDGRLAMIDAGRDWIAVIRA
jgi:2-polyprenyl-3-methyl-5-hydroxy-6-metoxy-1,4-benzoquinol methylase